MLNRKTKLRKRIMALIILCFQIQGEIFHHTWLVKKNSKIPNLSSFGRHIFRLSSRTLIYLNDDRYSNLEFRKTFPLWKTSPKLIRIDPKGIWKYIDDKKKIDFRFVYNRRYSTEQISHKQRPVCLRFSMFWGLMMAHFLKYFSELCISPLSWCILPWKSIEKNYLFDKLTK